MPNATVNRAFCGFTVNVGDGNVKLEFLGKKSIYDSLKSQLGLDHVSETHKEGYIKTSKGDMFGGSGQIYAIPVTVTGKVAGSTRTKVGKLVVPVDKAVDASKNLIGAKYGAWTIDTVYISGDTSSTY